MVVISFLNSVSKEHVFSKEYFLFVNIKLIHERSSLKQVLFFTKLNKIWIFRNEAILGLDDSKLKSSNITLLSQTCEYNSTRSPNIHLENIDFFVIRDFIYLQITSSVL